MKKVKDIIWNPDGWTVLQEADAAKHILEITCLAKDDSVIEVRMRHNDGEEQKFTKKLDATHTLPMSLADFKSAYLAGEITLK